MSVEGDRKENEVSDGAMTKKQKCRRNGGEGAEKG